MTRWLCIGLMAWSLTACRMEARKPVPAPIPSERGVTVEPRIRLLPTYPCSGCHAGRPVRTERHELKAFHVVRNQEYSHGEDAFWCYQCHSEKNLDRLRTATGELVTFNESVRICTSCHGDKLKDWRVGAHGLILGNWNGAKRKKACPACHDPHAPAFPLMKPMPPPAPAHELHLVTQ